MSLRLRKEPTTSNQKTSKIVEDLANPGKFVRLPDTQIETQLGSNSKIQPQTYSSSDDTSLSVFLLLSIAFSFQCALAFTGYSGQGKPPLFGDFEAQRHWMEITINLPVKEWYINSTDNDLLYWGLDYPPLTAYHSYLMGFVARKINASWVDLHASRGIETSSHRLFMRLTAICPFYLIYFPAIIVYFMRTADFGKNPFISRLRLLTFTILYPGILQIDNAHFQYNSISLGLFLWSYIFLENERFLAGSILFVLALNYKQLELYHALPIFVYILARNIKHPIFENLIRSIASISKIGLVVLGTFFVLWAPFTFQGTQQITAVLKRIFPFQRGLYEDKVASFWCAFSFVLKRIPNFELEKQLLASTTLVLGCSLPSLVPLFLRPTNVHFRLATFNVALSFFLFSFHVHEKTILLVAIPAFLLLNEKALYRDMVAFLTVSATSMFSLCIKDENASFLFCLAAFHLFGAWMRRHTVVENVS
ncbi:hypothetical protein WR25_21702 [Diploscapter pachys]|uniref:Alpha-1,3-glucosyltransferase n=1 Tax=Diploscapter pachys TaxID=2018661 RepID=A0A2A2LCM2_9BILA|nr:hypothetical protein WR25_21702 [Diploscapter pachys]